MRLAKRYISLLWCAGFWLGLDAQQSPGLAQWHVAYQSGLAAMQQGDWNRAIEKFQLALQVKNQDAQKLRSTGTMFIVYFPHREMGICYFNLGDPARARQELEASLLHVFSERAKNYLDRVNRGDRPSEASPSPPATTASTRPAGQFLGPAGFYNMPMTPRPVFCSGPRSMTAPGNQRLGRMTRTSSASVLAAGWKFRRGLLSISFCKGFLISFPPKAKARPLWA